jgi:division protein CdvB (Snf7/Vps24/ESCRT-III family)
MEKRPHRARVHKIIKSLLDSEIPEIQSTANKLAEQIKDLEEHSSRLQAYVTQIESLATDEANVMVESRITDILKDLDKALVELKQRSRKTLVTKPETVALPPRRAVIEETSEEEVEEVEEAEEIAPGQGMRLETYTTPEGYLIKKSRI